MNSFDRAAHTYESYGFIQREMAGWLAEWLPAERKGTAIEVGAGTGFFTEFFLPWEGRLIVTDASPSMVDQGSARWTNLEWQRALADELPGVSADWIFSSSFLQWANDPVSMFRHWKSRLKPGGRILAGLFVSSTLPELQEVLPASAPLLWRGSEEWDDSLTRTGLLLCRSETVERIFVFRSAHDLLRTLHRTGAAPARRASATTLRRAMREYDQRFPAQNGVRSTWTFHRLEAMAPRR